MATKKVTPVLVILLKDDCGEVEHLGQVLPNKIIGPVENSGWVCLVLTGAEYSKVEAFGLDESDLPKFEELKKTIDGAINEINEKLGYTHNG